MRKRPKWREGGWLAVAAGCAVVVSTLLTGDNGTPAVAVGFSFSPHAASYRGLSPTASLNTLLTNIAPDVVRLPVYWSDVSPQPSRTDFSAIESLLAVVRQHNTVAVPATQVILTVGARNMGYPEVWAPDWLDSPSSTTAALESTPAYDLYLRTTVSRYASDPLLAAWQLENEPFDDIRADRQADDNLSPDMIEKEIAEVKRIDPRHRVVVTTFDSATQDLDELAIASPDAVFRKDGPRPAGHPEPALASGADVLGLDAYVVTVNTPLRDASAIERIGWKANALAFWNQRAQSRSKALWVTEMQAEAIPDADLFTTEDLLYSAQAYRDSGVSLVMLWGVESWIQSPAWMSTGISATNILRRLA